MATDFPAPGNGSSLEILIIGDAADYDNDGLSNLREYLEGLNPTVFTSNRLASWRFNSIDWQGDQGQMPLTNFGLSSALVAGLEGGAIDLTGPDFLKKLLYRVQEEDTSVNLNVKTGTVRFWFKPQWSSQSNGGNGLSVYGCLVSLGVWTTNGGEGAWELVLDGSGDGIFIRAQDNAGHSSTTPLFTIAGGLFSNVWYHIVAVCQESNVSVYVNGALCGTTSSFMPVQLSQSVLDGGFTIGMDRAGGHKCKGIFEFFETFNYAQSGAQVAIGYSDPDQDGVPNHQEGILIDPFIRQLTIAIEKPLPGTIVPR
jgi:hypothetical protein